MRFTAFFNRAHRSFSGRYRNYSWRSYEALKPLLRRRFGSPPSGTVFIFGCQRSGTTHLERLFRADPRSVVHGEYSALSVTPDRTLWMPFAQMHARLAQDEGAYAVVRSLLASHLVSEVLEAWPQASVFWVFRDSASVVDSMMRKWGGDFFEISKRVESAPDGSWDLADLWHDIQAEARTLAPEARGEDHIRDIYALFWFYRNKLALDFDLAAHPRVVMADYDDITTAPARYLDHGLSLAGVSPVGRRFNLETRSPSKAAKARKPKASGEIQARCDALYRKLQEAAAPQHRMILAS